MIPVLLQMTAVIACGVVWRRLCPGGFDPETLRRGLTSVVYHLFLPALVLQVLWRAPLDLDVARVVVSAQACLFASLLAAWFVLSRGRLERPTRGALLLAAAFPNATYLGLPVLESTFGDWARTVAVQFDLFACTPLLLTLGILAARHYSPVEEHGGLLRALLSVPPLWAAVAAVALNLIGAPMPAPLAAWLDLLAAAVVPLMLFSLGLGLSWGHLSRRDVRPLGAVVAIQLVFMPFVVLVVAHAVGLDGPMLEATVLEGAMPSMLLGLVLCDHYRLRTALFASAVTLTTLLSLATLPVWHGLLSS